MTISESDVAFLEANHSAAMITVGRDGMPKVARVGVALVDGKLWSSGTADRARTARLRGDPRCVLYVHSAAFEWLTLETSVTLLEGEDVAELSVRLFRVMQGRPDGPLTWYGGELNEEEFKQRMVDEQRLIYEFDLHKGYGLH